MKTEKPAEREPYLKRASKAIAAGLRQPRMGLRWVLLVSGVTLIGICVANLKLVGFGTDPMSTVTFGLADKTGISMGTWHLTLMMLMFIPVLILDPGRIGIGSLLNMGCIGYISDATRWVTARLMAGGELGMPARIIIFLASVAVFLVGAAFYTAADLGYASYDAIPILLADHAKKLRFHGIRMLWDLSFVIMGFLLGSEIGLTTLLLGFCLGPAISFIAGRLTKVLEA